LDPYGIILGKNSTHQTDHAFRKQWLKDLLHCMDSHGRVYTAWSLW